jgi:RNA polymerase sigma factor (sigma-70 family)
MNELDIAELLEQLATDRSEAAWSDFLDRYSPLIFQIVREFDRDEDRVADAYLFVCEHLCQKNFHRIRMFNPDEGIKFTTWLCIVARNLCTDWLRHKLGRPRVFEVVEQRSALDQEVFRALFLHGLTPSETTATLRPAHPGLTDSVVSQIAESLHRSLNPRQRWLLSVRRPVVRSLSDRIAPDGPTVESRVANPSPNPEIKAQDAEARSALARALRCLEPSDRLILRWRFEQELTLEQISRLAVLSGPQAAGRRIESVLQELRMLMADREVASRR